MVTLILKQIPSLCLQPVIQTQLPKINMLYKKGQKVLGTVCHQSKGSLRMYLHVLNNEAGKEKNHIMARVAVIIKSGPKQILNLLY